MTVPAFRRRKRIGVKIRGEMSLRVGIICSEFNGTLVKKLFDGAKETFLKQSVEIIKIMKVPGAGEIPQAGKWLLETYQPDGLLACGVILRGETSHFDSLCGILEKGLIYLQMNFPPPTVFSVLMAENRLQAEERLGGAKGHRGRESAKALIQMIQLRQTFGRKTEPPEN